MREAAASAPRRGLADRLARQIRLMIQAGPYREGDRLPSIMEMARRFEVGHPAVREALQKLEAVGTVEIRHGSGVYVSRSDDAMVVASPGYAGVVTGKLLVDLIRARAPLEVQSVAFAARHATGEHLEEMARLLERAGRSFDDDGVLSALNMAFHRQIALASGNVVLVQLLDVVQELFAEEQRLILNIFGSRERDHREHRAILEALTLRDAPLAAERMREHLAGVEEVLLRSHPDEHPVS